MYNEGGGGVTIFRYGMVKKRLRTKGLDVFPVHHENNYHLMYGNNHHQQCHFLTEVI